MPEWTRTEKDPTSWVALGKLLGSSIRVCWRVGTDKLAGPLPLHHLQEGHIFQLVQHVLEDSKASKELTRMSHDQRVAKLQKHLCEQANKSLTELDAMLSIPEFRTFDSKTADAGFNGHKVIEQLKQMRTPPFGQHAMKLKFQKVEQFVQRLLGDDSVTLEIPDNLELLINMNGNRLALRSYGTGIHHLAILCAAIAMNESMVYTIEEPETHLHPDLQRKFLQFILEQTNNTYFITTHSNVFLDAGIEGSLYHVGYNGRASTMRRIEAPPDTRAVLSDMGFKASDLLQSNCIVWVEGPSDRLYIRKWLELVDPALQEGLHYSFAFYGGAVLSHFSGGEIDEIGDYIKILLINRHAYVVMDHDGEAGSELAERKRRILEALSDDYCWVTQGREIENYLSPSLLHRAYKSKYEQMDQETFGDFEHIEEFLKRCDGPTSFDKVDAAHKVAACMKPDDLARMDLRSKVERVVKYIRTANHM